MKINKIFKTIVNLPSIVGFLLNILQTTIANFLLGYMYYSLFSVGITSIRLITILLLATLYFLIIIPASGYLMETVEAKFKKAIKSNVMDHIIKDQENIDDKTALLILQHDVDSTAQIYSWPIVIFFQAIVAGLFSAIILWKYSILMTFLIFTSGILFVGLNLFTQTKMKDILSQMREWRGTRNQFLYECTQNIRAIKMYNMFDYTQKRLAKLNNKINIFEKKFDLINAFFGILEGILLEGFLSIVVIVFGSYLISKNRMPYNSLLLLVQVSTGFTFLFSSVTNLYRAVQNLFISKDKVETFMKEHPITLKTTITDKVVNIVFENCTLGYSDKTVLNKVNLQLTFPNYYTFTGENGTGKSTIFKSVLGMIPPKEGALKINGVDIYKNHIVLGNKIGYIPQNTYIFNDTLKNNILLGRKIDTKHFKDILTYVGLETHLNKVNAVLNTSRDNGTISLSEGEKKRLSIARAILENPPLLFIDEYDSNLDEENMIQILDKLSNDFSIVMITHNKFLKERMIKIDLKSLSK